MLALGASCQIFEDKNKAFNQGHEKVMIHSTL